MKKKRKRKGLDLEAPEVISCFESHFLRVRSSVDVEGQLGPGVEVLICLKGWDFCLAGQRVGEDPTREKSA